MPVQIIDTIKPKNGLPFPVAESNDVLGGFHQVSTIEERNAIPIERRVEGLACYVAGDINVNYQLVQGITNDHWEEFAGGGSGGSGGVTVGTLTSDLIYGIDGFSNLDNNILATGEILKIPYTFKSPTIGNGTLFIYLDGNLIYEGSIKQGRNEFIYDQVLPKKTTAYRINMVAKDRGGVLTNEIYIKVRVGALEITSDFDDSKEYFTNKNFSIPFVVDSIYTDAIVVEAYLNGNLKETITANRIGQTYYYDLGYLTPNLYTVTLIVKSGEITGNTITKNILVASTTTPSIYTSSETEITISSDQSIVLPYRLSMAGKNELFVRMYEDGVLISKGKVRTGSNEWIVGLKPIKDTPYVFQITCETVPVGDAEYGEVKGETFVEYNVTVTQGSYQKQDHVTSGLYAYYAAAGRSNSSTDKNLWPNKATGGLEKPFELYNFTYGANNGWITSGEESYLRLNGNSYASIDYRPFEKDFYGYQNGEFGEPYDGYTFDILLRVNEVGNENHKAVCCQAPVAPYAGFAITLTDALITSNLEGISTRTGSDQWTRVTYVINRNDTKEKTGILYIYIDGVISRIKNLTSSDLEYFKSSSKIYLNCELNSFGEPDNFGACDIKSIRIYNRALTSDEVVQNFIADIENTDIQKEAVEFNNAMSKLPVFKFFREYKDGKPVDDFGEATQKNSVKVRVEYNGALGVFGDSFTIDDYVSELQYQGTSTLQYAKKNYKIKLNYIDQATQKKKKYKFSPFDASRKDIPERYSPWLPESKFTLKVNYMESSQSFNAGMARFVNGMYKSLSDPALVPPQADPSYPNHDLIRAALDGFPIRIELDGEDQGVHVMLLDKGADDNLGFNSDYYPYVQSWEMSSNSDIGAGAFRDTSLSAIFSQYECRYIPEKQLDDEGHEIVTVDTDEFEEWYEAGDVRAKPWHLIRFIKWVNDIGTRYEAAAGETAKDAVLKEFKDDVDNNVHLDKKFTLLYYLNTLTFAMVDNYGKNMMLNTWDGQTFFPSYYDMD